MARKVENKAVFRWFFNNFQNPPDQLLYVTQVRSKCFKGEVVDPENMGFWDGQGGLSEPLQFCGSCKSGILEWIGVKMKSVEIKKLRGQDMKRMKERMKECEWEFEKCGIYERDPRYFRVRSKFLKLRFLIYIFMD